MNHAKIRAIALVQLHQDEVDAYRVLLEIEAAVLAEREACADIARAYAVGLERNYSANIEEKIWERGEK